MNTKSDILIRVYLSLLFFVILGFLIIGQISKIQFKEGKHWRSLSDSLTLKYKPVEAIRGNIYSDEGKLLVSSIPNYEVRLDFKTQTWQNPEYFTANIDSFSLLLSRLFQDQSEAQYRKEITKARNQKARYYLLKRKINYNSLKKLKNFPFIREGKYKGGLIVIQRNIRIHPFKLLAERTIGFKKPDIKGVGIEAAYDEYLSGISGKRLMQRISGGNYVPVDYDNTLDPEDGKDIITTINIDMQDATESALLNALIEHQAENGCAVVMEVKTGQIKAIANLKKDKDGIYKELYNYAVGASTEPGSTFKLISALVLLEKGLIKPNDLIDTRQGEYTFYDRVMKDSKEDGYGLITFKQAFEVSSNIAFSTLIHKHFSKKPKEFINYLKDLSITQSLDIELPGEGKPVFKQPGTANWSGTTLPWMSVGYELQMTPLQILAFYNAIANDGVMMKPIFVKEIKKVNKTVKEFAPVVINDNICSKKTCQTLKGLMEGVVENGTASNIFSSNYKIAGKTGTALVAFKGSYESNKSYQASFVGYFPADNPQYSCIVVINNPLAGQIYGASVAAPVFKNIADKIFVRQKQPYVIATNSKTRQYQQLLTVSAANKNDLIVISSTLGIEMKIQPDSDDWVSIEKHDAYLKLNSKRLKPAIIPDVRGMSLSDATCLLESAGLRVYAMGYGKVISQSLLPGGYAVKNYQINLTLSQ